MVKKIDSKLLCFTPGIRDEANQDDQKRTLTAKAAINEGYTLRNVIDSSEYLMQEECHPVLFELDLVNPELIPE